MSLLRAELAASRPRVRQSFFFASSICAESASRKRTALSTEVRMLPDHHQCTREAMDPRPEKRQWMLLSSWSSGHNSTSVSSVPGKYTCAAPPSTVLITQRHGPSARDALDSSAGGRHLTNRTSAV